jgi:hypothetical protein
MLNVDGLKKVGLVYARVRRSRRLSRIRIKDQYDAAPLYEVDL